MALILKKKKPSPPPVEEAPKPAPKRLVLKRKEAPKREVSIYAEAKKKQMDFCDGIFDAARGDNKYSPAYVSYYLMASYLYYVHDVPLLTDAKYDEICQHLSVHYDHIEHRHKKLINRDLLDAGSGYALDFEKFPLITISAAIRLANGMLGTDIGPVVLRR